MQGANEASMIACLPSSVEMYFGSCQKTGNAWPRIENVTFNLKVTFLIHGGFNGHIQSHLHAFYLAKTTQQTGQTWLATIRRDTWQLGIELDDVPELAVDGALWRGMTRGATHHPGACS